MSDSPFATGIDCKIIISDDCNAFKAFYSLTDDIQFLLIGKEATLVDVYTCCHYHLIEHCQSSLKDVQMACCKWIKGSRE